MTRTIPLLAGLALAFALVLHLFAPGEDACPRAEPTALHTASPCARQLGAEGEGQALPEAERDGSDRTQPPPPTASEIEEEPSRGEIRVEFLGVVPTSPGERRLAASEEASGPSIGEADAVHLARRYLERVFAEEEPGPGVRHAGAAAPVELEVLDTTRTRDGFEVRLRASVYGDSAVLCVRIDGPTGEVDERRSLAPSGSQIPRIDPQRGLEIGVDGGMAPDAEVSLALDPHTRRLVWRVRDLAGPGKGTLAGLVVDIATGDVVAEERFIRSRSDRPGFERLTVPIEPVRGEGRK